ncbi:Ras-related protein RABA2a [Cyberlindnera fabianii]|uniref:Ras-related protein RABA2a n=1 Tax=Cyberlindnera fabianii TaxID=36022 RepID=A0A1V2LC31_CYBFA|nr:Ras-related protein RABA2a [Cyberlindnera fabianii]
MNFPNRDHPSNREVRLDQIERTYKIILVGDAGVGKTNIQSRIAGIEFSSDTKPTIGVDFSSRVVNVEGRIVRSQIWDTSGQERYMAMVKGYYRKADAAIIVYDITRADTAVSVGKWAEELYIHGGDSNPLICLVGNKTDLNHLRGVLTEDMEGAAKIGNYLFIETSAHDNTNIEFMFQQLMKALVHRDGDLNHPINDKEKRISDTSFSSGTTITTIDLKPTPAPKGSKKKSSNACAC